MILTDPNKRVKLLIGALIILLVTIIAGIFYGRYFGKDKDDAGRSIFVKPARQVEEPLTGEKIDESKAGRTPIALVIENHPEARPQVGLEQASLVYEAISEGGITRFLALFSSNQPDKVGPVRSARTFFVHWAREYNAPFAHVGGNIDALDLIKQTGARDLDQFRYGLRAYHREPRQGIATEHTMFGSLPKLREIAKQNGWSEPSKFDKFTFKEDAPSSERPANQTVTVDFSTPVYQTKWTYRPETNDYIRTIEGKQYVAKNITVQEVIRTSVVSRNEVPRFEFTLTGQGKAKIIRDGAVIEATWKKQGTSRTKFYDKEGKEISFNRGVTWYEIIHPELTVKIE